MQVILSEQIPSKPVISEMNRFRWMGSHHLRPCCSLLLTKLKATPFCTKTQHALVTTAGATLVLVHQAICWLVHTICTGTLVGTRAGRVKARGVLYHLTSPALPFLLLVVAILPLCGYIMHCKCTAPLPFSFCPSLCCHLVFYVGDIMHCNWEEHGALSMVQPPWNAHLCVPLCLQVCKHTIVLATLQVCKWANV